MITTLTRKCSSPRLIDFDVVDRASTVASLGITDMVAMSNQGQPRRVCETVGHNLRFARPDAVSVICAKRYSLSF